MKNHTAKEPSVASPPLAEVYKALYREWGPQYWWPGHSRMEMIVGAVLTQNTAWINVEQAIRRLRKEKALNLKTLHEVDVALLADWIRPAGYFNIKTQRLKSFVAMVYQRTDGDLNRLFREETRTLRNVLLAVKGIGPETADSILLYAGKREVFVVDAYTKRFLLRHGWIHEKATYDEIASLMTESIPKDHLLYNEYHALIVHLGKEHCCPTHVVKAVPWNAGQPRERPSDMVTRKNNLWRLCFTCSRIVFACFLVGILTSSCQNWRQSKNEANARKAPERIEITLPGAEVAHINKEEGYAILECTILPSEAEEAKVYRDGQAVGLLRITELQRGPFVVADILVGKLNEGDEVRFKCAVSSTLKEVLP